MSRGMEAMDTVFATGSSEATIIVSVSAVFRPTPESMPISRTLTRGTPGVADGAADGEAEAEASAEAEVDVEGDGDASMPKSGSSDATGGAVWSGTQAPPESDGPNTIWAESCASTVRFAAQSCGATTMTTATTAATAVANAGRNGAREPASPRAPRRQISSTAWSASSAPRMAGSKRRAANEVVLPSRTAITAAPPITSSRTSGGRPRMAAQRRRPAAMWPRPGQSAVSRKMREADAGRWA